MSFYLKVAADQPHALRESTSPIILEVVSPDDALAALIVVAQRVGAHLAVALTY